MRIALVLVFLLLAATPAPADWLDNPITEETVRREVISRLALDPQISSVSEREDGGLDIRAAGGGGSTSFLDNLLRELRTADRSEREEILTRFIDVMLRSAASEDPIVPERLMLSVYDGGYLEALLERNRREPPAGIPAELAVPATRTISAGLLAFLILDSPSHVRTVNGADMRNSGLDDDRAWSIAMGNLRSHAAGLTFDDIDGMHVAVLDGYYENAMLLLPEIWPGIARLIGGTPVVATPARGLLIVVRGEDSAMVDDLAAVATRLAGERRQPISDRLYRWTGSGWEPL